MQTYLWERETEQGSLLSDRQPIQSQLPDPAEVPLTICLFGERCGVPLQDELQPDWEERIASWGAKEGEPGLVHPWPRSEAAQAKVLRAGGFPLTGTVFELLSALSQDKKDNLVLGYVADKDVANETDFATVRFNQQSLHQRLSGKLSIADLDRLYHPQVHALFNLLNYYSKRKTLHPPYASAEAMVRHVAKRSQEKLRSYYKFASGRNPFKNSLEHWALDELRELPGRDDLIGDIVTDITTAPAGERPYIWLLHGASGCGKSSILQRGILHTLRERENYKVLVVRPTDLAGPNGTRPVIDMIWDRICAELRECRDPDIEGASSGKKPGLMARRLKTVLQDRHDRFALGLDQFEEILDELALRPDGAGGWWQLMRLLKELVACRSCCLIGTLEEQRIEKFKRLELERFLVAQPMLRDVAPSAGDIARIAEVSFARAGLRLDVGAVEEIKNRWQIFEKQSPHLRNVSPLPLVGLWLYRVYKQFEHRAAPESFEHRAAPQSGDGALTAVMDVATAGPAITRVDPITRDDLEKVVAFDGLITSMAEEAWEAAGAFRTGTGQPDKDTLFLFLKPLLGLGDGGGIRLLAAPAVTGIVTYDSLMQSFKKWRLLVPVDGLPQDAGATPRMLRIVHQALIDNWPPARNCLEAGMASLKLEETFLRWAKADEDIAKAVKLRVNDESIQQAAQILDQNRIAWIGCNESDLPPDAAAVRRFATALFSHAADPNKVILGNPTGKLYVHLAAQYHFQTLLTRFIAADGTCANSKSTDKSTPLHAAGWTDGEAVELLLKNDAQRFAGDGDGWHPITGAIQRRANANFVRLLREYENVDVPVGPDGRTMMHLAAEWGNVFAIDRLLDRHASPILPDARKQQPLFWAAMEGRVEAFRRLLPLSDLLASDSGLSALHVAAARGHAGIIAAVLHDEDISDEKRQAALIARDADGMTPLMEAAAKKRVEAMRLLLSECDPNDPRHAMQDRRTLLHLAVWKVDEGKPRDDQRVRARQTVELLLKDRRLDPNKTAGGRTAYDQSADFEDARHVLREDERVPTDYDKLTPQMRIDDLSSRKPAVVLKLLRSAPRALTDTHRIGNRRVKGIEFVLKSSSADTLAMAILEGLVPDSVLEDKFNTLLAMAHKREAQTLRGALLAPIKRLDKSGQLLPSLLDAALRAGDEDTEARLKDLCVDRVLGLASVQLSIFHELAINGGTTRFEALARRRRLRLPLDAWGRRPSELASEKIRASVRKIERQCFDEAAYVTVAPPATSTIFHERAWHGDLHRFERYACGATIAVPRDEQGRKPSDLAADAFRAQIRALEERCFQKEN